MASSETYQRVDPASRPMQAWRARKAVMASRNEIDGPRVEECAAALRYWRFRQQLEWALTEGLVDQGLVDEADAVARRMVVEGCGFTEDPPEVSGPVAHVGPAARLAVDVAADDASAVAVS